uniref:Cadherin domain-containing protein n=1 Tax=Timema bartmani TaxID=61472 RepID=A0A7R9EVL5_9NEOP|nr:unnamed protein product [Timema bartmani]
MRPSNAKRFPTPDLRGKLSTLDQDSNPDLSVIGCNNLVLYFLQELDGDDDLFSVSTVNGKGVIRLTGQLDYERKFIYQLRVLAVDRANNNRVNTGTAAIVVKVQDVEDQPPEFVVASPVTRVSEDAAIGTSVLQVKAVDGDRGINNRIVYSITQGSQGSFEIDADSGVVFTQQKLDRESSTNNNGAYILEIAAQEETQSTFPPPMVKTEVTVIVTDVNDEIPTFRSLSYIGVINENAQVNTPVAFLDGAVPEVFDHDQGTNGTFVMFIDGDHGVFDVTPHKGVNEASFLIRVKDSSKLDFEKVSTMNFTLIARETIPQNAKYSLVPVTVHIKDMNDNFPEFTKPLYEVSVLENSNAGTTVAWVQAMDEDSGNFGTQGIRYTNLGGSVSDLLYLDPNTGVITIKSIEPAFDRELMSRHYLTVEARDDLGDGILPIGSQVNKLQSVDFDLHSVHQHIKKKLLEVFRKHRVESEEEFAEIFIEGSPVMQCVVTPGNARNTAQLIINVEDVNDNAPQFLHSKYEAHLLENKLEFESLLVIEARDLDLNGTRNSHIYYSIVSGDPYKNFTIDSILGTLQPATPVDFEELTVQSVGPKGPGFSGVNVRPISLTVEARDHGKPSLASQVEVVVYVQDVNDHMPQFEHASYKQSIQEDLPGGSSVLQVQAWDGDGSSPNNAIVYRIQQGAEDKFVIDAETGVISVAIGANLDPDRTEPKTTLYTLSVLALDGGVGAEQFQNAVDVKITIVDVNNKAPIFIDPGTIRVRENTQVTN